MAFKPSSLFLIPEQRKEERSDKKIGTVYGGSHVWVFILFCFVFG